MDDLFTYQYLDIEHHDEIVGELRQYYHQNRDLYLRQFNGIAPTQVVANCPHFKRWIITNKLKVAHAYYVVIGPHDTSSLHVDAQENDLSINFPIENCLDTWTTMYQINSPLVYREVYPGGLRRHWHAWDSADPEKTEICRCVVSQALIFNTKIPHQVNNPTDQDRVTFILRFREDPHFLIHNNGHK
jgi:hypothetical protein